MKKIITILVLMNFLLGCNENSESKVSKEQKKQSSINENTNKNKSIFNRESIEVLEKLKKNLKILYTYSTEKKYVFSYPDTNLGILENSNYIYLSHSKNNIFTYVNINLENLQSSIILGNDYTDENIEVSQEDFMKIIKKLEEITVSTTPLVASEEMEVIIFNDIAGKFNNININTKLVLKKEKNQSIIIFKNLEDDSKIFAFNLNINGELGLENTSESINNVINKYSDVLLGQIINLGQKYERLNYLVKNSKEIVSCLTNENSDFKYTDFLEYNKIREFNLNITYYSSGRVKFLGDHEFENNSDITRISSDITLLKEEIGEIHTPWQLDNYRENIFNIIYFIQKEELNLNPTNESKENLKKLKDEVRPLFDKFDKIIEESKKDEKIIFSSGMYGVFYPSGRIKIYGDRDGYLGEFFYEDKPLNYEEIQKAIDETKKIVNSNIENRTYDHVWQLQEYLYPKLEGYEHSKNLSEKEKSQLKNLKEQVDEINNKYKNSNL